MSRAPFVCLLTCLLALLCGAATAAGTLGALRGQYRAIVVFMPTDAAAREAIEELAGFNGFAVRDTVWFVLGPETFESNFDPAIRRRTGLAALHRAGGFEAVLIGKDGDVKARQTEELDISAFIDAIDHLPIRQHETWEEPTREDDDDF